MSIRLQSVREEGDESMEKKDHISYDHGSASSDDVEKVINFYNLGNAYYSLADFKKAIECYNLHLKIAKEVGDKNGEGNAYNNLVNAYYSLGDFKTAIDYHNLHLKIANVCS